VTSASAPGRFPQSASGVSCTPVPTTLASAEGAAATASDEEEEELPPVLFCGCHQSDWLTPVSSWRLPLTSGPPHSITCRPKQTKILNGAQTELGAPPKPRRT
jgi:hypothetical protein